MIKNSTEFREHVKSYFKTKFSENESCDNHAINLEIGIFNYSVREATNKKIVKSWENKHFQQLYIDRLRSIYFNLTPKIISRILEKTLKPQDFAFMTHQEFCPEKWEELITKKHKRENSQNVSRQCPTDLFTCKKCSSKNCSYSELQIRSADEPATLFISCLDCGKHWRM
jgi:DNA-directed RNA polymerase subunit M/transcription elongation factor TFIIS